MFSKLVFAVAAFSVLAAATPVPAVGASCNTGPITCCNTVQKASDLSADAKTLFGLLGLELKIADQAAEDRSDGRFGQGWAGSHRAAGERERRRICQRQASARRREVQESGRVHDAAR